MTDLTIMPENYDNIRTGIVELLKAALRCTFYRAWPESRILQTVSGEFATTFGYNSIKNNSPTVSTLTSRFALPWSAYVRMLAVKHPEARSFYETESLRSGGPFASLTDRSIANSTSASRSRRTRLQCWKRLRPPSWAIQSRPKQPSKARSSFNSSTSRTSRLSANLYARVAHKMYSVSERRQRCWVRNGCQKTVGKLGL
jgi:hypothetical protein